MRSECSARDVNTFWPLTRYAEPSGDRLARVWMRVVSDPAVGSVMPKACSRSSPDAMAGRYRRFCSSEPCRRIEPIVYICAWHAAPFPPDALISSRTAAAAATPRPPPPYSSGIRTPSHPADVNASTNSFG